MEHIYLKNAKKLSTDEIKELIRMLEHAQRNARREYVLFAPTEEAYLALLKQNIAILRNELKQKK